MVNMTIADRIAKIPAAQVPSRPVSTIIKYSGNFGATETETTVDIVPVDAYRSILMSVIGSAWGTATVVVKIYPCDSQGNTIGSNPFFSISLTANGTTVVIISEMGGAVTAAVYPPASPASTGSFIGPFANFVKITETCSVFTSGTNTVSVELDNKG